MEARKMEGGIKRKFFRVDFTPQEVRPINHPEGGLRGKPRNLDKSPIRSEA